MRLKLIVFDTKMIAFPIEIVFESGRFQNFNDNKKPTVEHR